MVYKFRKNKIEQNKKTKITSRKIGEKPQTRMVNRNFASAPSKEKNNTSLQLYKDELQEDSKKQQKRIKSLYEKGKISYNQLTNATNIIISNDSCCITLITLLESFEFESQLQFESIMENIRKTIFTLKTDLMQNLKTELGQEVPIGFGV